jgi:hypothetical protein
MTNNGWRLGRNGSVKFRIFIVAYSSKWLLTKNLKEGHGLMAKKAKVRRLLISKRSL